jgi:tetratricopeptide (TPR) repeat protein
MSETSTTPDDIEQGLRLAMESCPAEERMNASHALAMHLMNCGQYDKALPHFELLSHAMTTKIAMADAAHNMGICLMQTGYLESARESFEKAANLAPGNAAPHLRLSTLFRMTDDFDAARHHAAIAISKAEAANDSKTLIQAYEDMSVLIRMFPTPEYVM